MKHLALILLLAGATSLFAQNALPDAPSSLKPDKDWYAVTALTFGPAYMDAHETLACEAARKCVEGFPNPHVAGPGELYGKKLGIWTILAFADWGISKIPAIHRHKFLRHTIPHVPQLLYFGLNVRQVIYNRRNF